MDVDNADKRRIGTCSLSPLTPSVGDNERWIESDSLRDGMRADESEDCKDCFKVVPLKGGWRQIFFFCFSEKSDWMK